MGLGFLLGVMKMCWNLIVVMFAKVSDYIKNHQILHFKRVDFILCEHVNKTKQNLVLSIMNISSSFI